MKTLTCSISPRRLEPRGFSLVEMSMVIALVLGLSLFMGYGIGAMRKWQKGKDAALALQAVHAAQRGYMADHPTADIAGVTTTALQAYLPQGWSSMPVVTGLEDEALGIDHGVMPPRFTRGEQTYDPSGSAHDGLWDTGE